MKITCSVIQDLIPLYLDGVCSEDSRENVEEHIAGCDVCRRLCDSMRADTLDKTMKCETDMVIQKQGKAMRRKSFTVGAVFAGILMIPVIVCLIVNLATGAALNWFFIVLTALMLAASLTVVPMMVPGRRFLYALASSTVSLLLLLLTCAVYTGGEWFFVAGSSTLFGLAAVFLPFAVRCEPLKTKLSGHKALAVFAADTVLYALMMTCIGLYVPYEGFARLTISISAPLVIFVWVIMLVLCYLPVNKAVRAGVCAALTGAVAFFTDGVIQKFLGGHMSLPRFMPFVWSGDTVDGNVKWLCLLVGVVVGAVLILAGLGRKDNRK